MAVEEQPTDRRVAIDGLEVDDVAGGVAERPPRDEAATPARA